MLARYLMYLRAAGMSTGSVRLRMVQLRKVERAMGPLQTLHHYDLVDWLSRQDWKPETRRSNRAALHGFYRWAVDEGLIEINPARRLPIVRVPVGVPRPAPTPVLVRALKVASDRDRIMIHLAAFAGLRRSEIANLKWSDITPSNLRVTGKGGRTRTVPLVAALRLELEAERARREAGSYGSGWRFGIDPLSLYVLPGRDGIGPISADCVGRTLARLLGEKWTGHTLRHRFATAAYAVERDLLTVQQLLGHARPETTARYTAIPDDAARRAVEGATLPEAA